MSNTTKSQEEVTRLFEQYQDFIEMQVVLVRRIFFLSKEDFEDCVQEANIAFLKATNTYDENKTASFDTYAAKVIKNAVLDYIKVNCKHDTKKVNEETSEYYIESLEAENHYGEAEIMQYLKDVYETTESKTIKLGIKTAVLLANGYDYAQTASVLKAPESTVRSALCLFRKSYALKEGAL